MASLDKANTSNNHSHASLKKRKMESVSVVEIPKNGRH